jgi:hypothetical protein
LKKCARIPEIGLRLLSFHSSFLPILRPTSASEIAYGVSSADIAPLILRYLRTNGGEKVAGFSGAQNQPFPGKLSLKG